MAILADNCNPLDEEIFMTAAMRLVANEAILLRRGMHPDKGSAFIDMAGEAKQVRRLRLDHSPGQGSVDTVTIAAFYLTLQDRMTGLLTYLRLLVSMAFKTDRQLIRYGISRMHTMA